MVSEKQFIKDFRKDKDLGDGLRLLLTVKSFDLGTIRKRYVASRESKSGKVGSVERREPSMGGLVEVKFRKGKIEEFNILEKLREPRGITSRGELLAYSSENKVIIKKGEDRKEITNDWFSYIHALDISPFDENKILISSSGLDCIFEYDLSTMQKTWEWFAWENYKNEAIDPISKEMIHLTRNPEEHRLWTSEGKNVKFIDDPRAQHLPTAMRAAFINSVSYSRKDKERVIATLFHEGKSISIDQRTGQVEDHISGLLNPHGAWQFEDLEMASSTSSGEVVIQKEGREQRFDLADLPNKHSEMLGKEWLQNSIFHDGTIISIDSNRTSFIIFDLSKKTYNQIAYDSDWAVQDCVILKTQ